MSKKTRPERLLPCTGFDLARSIIDKSQAVYRREKSEILEATEERIQELMAIRGLNLRSIIEWETHALQAMRGFRPESQSVRSSLRFLANSVLTSGTNGLERSRDKFNDLISAVQEAIKLAADREDIAFLQSLGKIQKVLDSFESDTDTVRIYRDVESLRRSKSAATTKNSRIRRIASVVLDTDIDTNKLAAAALNSKSDAKIWMNEVASQFARQITGTSKWNSNYASYEKYWYEIGLEVIDANEGTSSHIEQEFIRTLNSKREEKSEPLLAKLSSSMQNDFSFPVNKSVARETVGLDLKIRGNAFEAHFILPSRLINTIAEIQIRVLTMVQAKFGVNNLTVTSTLTPNAQIIVTCQGMPIEKFSQIQLEVLKFLSNH